jgi:isoaspartyl peptidase/L-asparaginase-like protein (Ntn-hydrolase superfamily)
MPVPVVIATWPFGKLAVDVALPMVAAGKPVLDAVIAGAQAVENDPAVHSVGFGSLPDRIGRLTLDSCVMDGKTLSCGAVAGLEHIRSASGVARLVMDKTPHVLLVGEGAKWFALKHGYELEMPHTLDGMREWFEKHPKAQKKADREGKPRAPFQGPDDLMLPVAEDNHDTVTVLGASAEGRLGGVCTTSGLAYKLPGRVGDSPIIGAGLYVDDEAGAAGATGVGEEVIRIGGSLYVVEQMRAGKSPQEACELAVKRIHRVAVRRGVHPPMVAFLALNPKGEVGAAATERSNFVYAVGRAGKVEMRTAKELGPEA